VQITTVNLSNIGCIFSGTYEFVINYACRPTYPSCPIIPSGNNVNITFSVVASDCDTFSVNAQLSGSLNSYKGRHDPIPDSLCLWPNRLLPGGGEFFCHHPIGEFQFHLGHRSGKPANHIFIEFWGSHGLG